MLGGCSQSLLSVEFKTSSNMRTSKEHEAVTLRIYETHIIGGVSPTVSGKDRSRRFLRQHPV